MVTQTPTDSQGPRRAPGAVRSLWCCPSLHLSSQGVSTSQLSGGTTTIPPRPEGAPNCQLGTAGLGDLETGQGRVGPYQSCPRPSGSSASPGPHTAAGSARRPPWRSCPGGCCRWPAACPLARGCQSCMSRGVWQDGTWRMPVPYPPPLPTHPTPGPGAPLPVCHTAFLDVRDGQGLPSLPAGRWRKRGHDSALGGGTQDWGMDLGPQALLPLLPGWVAVSRSAQLSVPQFPFCRMGVMPHTSQGHHEIKLDNAGSWHIVGAQSTSAIFSSCPSPSKL